MTNKLFIGVITVATAASLFGCGAPSQTATAPTTDTSLAPEAAFVGDRHVLATGETLTFEQIRAQLPQQISLADAERMLETVDPSTIVADAADLTIQQRRYRSYRRGGHHFFFNRRHSFRFFRHRNILFPFHRVGSFYRPFTFATHSPFLYAHRNVCYPFSYHY